MDAQARFELAPGLGHVPGRLYVAALLPVFVCMVLGVLPTEVRQFVVAQKRLVPAAIAVLVALGWLVLAAFASHAIRRHWQRHEPVYAAIDVWKMLVFVDWYYWAEGQIFPSLPAVGFAQVCFILGFMSQLFVVPIFFDWYSRRYQHRTAPTH